MVWIISTFSPLEVFSLISCAIVGLESTKQNTDTLRSKVYCNTCRWSKYLYAYILVRYGISI